MEETQVTQSKNAEQAARDDAHLRSLGIKPELQRTLGFLSNFAVAFSYISVSTGTFTLFAVGIGVGGPAFFWAWPIVILGQLFVALNFAELASHFPVAGSIYQWSKRLSHRTLGWFTGWIYFWAGVLTTTAVAITVPLVLSSIMGIDLASPDPTGLTTMSIFLTLVVLVSTTLINAFGVRLLSLINNIGVGAEILASLSAGQQIVKIVRDELVELLSAGDRTFRLHGNPAVIALVGLHDELGARSTAGGRRQAPGEGGCHEGPDERGGIASGRGEQVDEPAAGGALAVRACHGQAAMALHQHRQQVGPVQHRQAAGLGDAAGALRVDDDAEAAYLGRERGGGAEQVGELRAVAADEERQAGVGRHRRGGRRVLAVTVRGASTERESGDGHEGHTGRQAEHPTALHGNTFRSGVSSGLRSPTRPG